MELIFLNVAATVNKIKIITTKDTAAISMGNFRETGNAMSTINNIMAIQNKVAKKKRALEFTVMPCNQVVICKPNCCRSTFCADANVVIESNGGRPWPSVPK